MSGDREREVIDLVERRRRLKPKLKEELVTLSHGAGGKATRVLVEALFLEELGNPTLSSLGDAGVFGERGRRLALSTDSFVVKPLFFPGGNIGDLAVNGTVNDVLMSGARPLGLAASFILEEGFAVAGLRHIAASMGDAARAAGVLVVAGDTKVVERGKADGVYVTTTGIGLVEGGRELSPDRIRPGDAVIVSGTLGDHGTAVMVARGELELEVDLRSDTAALTPLVKRLLEATGEVRCLRDPTRGGIATVLNEFALQAGVSIVLDEASLPVKPEVVGACEILGIDPLYVANEGKLVAVVGPEGAEAALASLRSHPLGADAAVVGEVRSEPEGLVLLDTAFGGRRVVDMLVGDPLPRIC